MERTDQCYDGPATYVLDVSHHQGTIDWARVAAHRWTDAQGRPARITGAFVRALEGTTPDETFVRNWRGAKAAGLIVGPYVYFRARHTGAEQIAALKAMLARVGGFSSSDMPPLCDMETLDDQTRDTFLARLGDWVAGCKNTLGRTPWFYSGAFWHGYVASPKYAAYVLVTPDYRTRCAGVPRGWTTWTGHQFTSSAQVPGIPGNVDMSRFRGTEAQLASLIAASRGNGWLLLLGAAAGVGWWRWRDHGMRETKAWLRARGGVGKVNRDLRRRRGMNRWP